MSIKQPILIIFLILNFFISSAQWVNCNGPNGAEITCVGVKGNLILAACSTGYSSSWGQLYRSTDLGETWGDVVCSNGYEYTDIAIMDSIAFFSTSNNRVFRSLDSGLTWTVSLFVSSANNNTFLTIVGNQLFAAGAFGVYRTTDGGVTWTNASSGLPAQTVLDLASNGQQLFAVTANGIYRSDDWGQSWLLFNNGLLGISVSSVAARDSNVVAGSQNTGLFYSSDLGNSWTNIGFPISTIKDVEFYGDTIVVGKNNGIFYSANYGQNWVASNTGMGFREITKMAFDDTVLVAGTMGGVYRSYQIPCNWSLIGVPATDVIAMGGFGDVIFAGTIYENGESGGLSVSTNNGISWKAINAGLPFQNLYYEFPACFYAFDNRMVFSLYNHGLYSTSDTGATWVSASNGIADTQIVALRMNNGILYALDYEGNIYTTIDSAQSWNYFSTVPLLFMYTGLVDIAFHDTSIFVGTTGDEGMFVSHDNGLSWSSINNGLNYPNIWSMTILDSVLFAGTQPGGIHRSTDFGINWIPISLDTIEPWISAMISVNDLVFAGTVFTKGVVYSSDGGITWIDCNDGIYPQHDILDIRNFYVNDNYLFVSTGSFRTRFGIYRRPLSEFTGIDEPEVVSNEIQLYPNPANDQVTIQLHHMVVSGKIEIIDLSGKLLLKKTIQNSNIVNLNIGDFSPGMYMVMIQTAKKTYYKKLVVSGK